MCYNACVKKILFFACLLLYLFPRPSFASEDFTINSFKSSITIQEDGIVHVREDINVFFTSERHGIYRDIPYVYSSDGGTTYTQLEDITVLVNGEKSAPEITDDNHALRVRIGDPNVTVTGKQAYAISYHAKGVLRSFEGHDELYWNATGNNWQTKIEKAEVVVYLPKPGFEKIACFEGVLGAKIPCVAQEVNDKQASFVSTRSLSPGEGVTTVVGFQRGMVPILTVPPPKTLQDALFGTRILLAFLTTLLIGLYLVLQRWMQHGRDSFFQKEHPVDTAGQETAVPVGHNQPLVVEYTPPEKLRPAQIGVLMDERADTLDVTATIIDLAARGFLTITEIPKKWLFGKSDYTLEKMKKQDSELLGYEKALMGSLFQGADSVRISSLKKTFYDDLAEIKKLLYKDTVKNKFFPKNPEDIRSRYMLMSVFTLVAAGALVFIGIAALNEILIGVGIGGFVVGVVFMILSGSMPRRTALGYQTYQRARGYRHFITNVEKFRQPFFEKKNLWSEVLPYAIVFGIAEKYAKATADMGVSVASPSWYHGGRSSFIYGINGFSSSFSSAIAQTPSRSGGFSGGSSGGGFGGGGGGSW